MTSSLESRIRNQTRQQVDDDLAACIPALEDIEMQSLPSNTRGWEAMRQVAAGQSARAAVVLDSLMTPTTCRSCGGDGGLCGHCHGGGTEEHPCPVCHNSHKNECQDCGGSGVI